MMIFRPTKPSRAFSLVELLVVLIILGLISTFAVPAWRDSVMQARRTAATMILLHIANRQQQFRLQHKRYAGAEELTVAPPEGLGVSNSNRHYRFDIKLVGDGFSAIAAARPDGLQADDYLCRSFMIDSSGRRLALDKNGNSKTERCWRN